MKSIHAINMELIGKEVLGAHAVHNSALEVASDMTVHRFNGDLYHIITFGDGAYKAVENPFTENQKLLGTGHLSDFPEAMETITVH